MICYAWLCFPLICFDFEAGPSASPGPAGKCEKCTQFLQQFDPNRKFLAKIPFSDPFVGGDHGRAQKFKISIKA